MEVKDEINRLNILLMANAEADKKRDENIQLLNENNRLLTQAIKGDPSIGLDGLIGRTGKLEKDNERFNKILFAGSAVCMSLYAIPKIIELFKLFK